jgi:hypothetical protein
MYYDDLLSRSKNMQIANIAHTPFWGTASIEIYLPAGFIFLCFARLLGPPCAPSMTNEANLIWQIDLCNVKELV